ncbi:PaaI family thioesterase [Defluviimonas sp. WL0002]|uniref:Medium/long-chain acyl-CoA thioesterase YigI n=1 Tax=Albidovulum marisflavi TaxID=2984159 RepID=A0ABT2ZA54_9RHOB|nr:PaaI family thioesterase [Defluviimonas sp. WL0002]MCV2868009.1 PaaI family thioesterase [Defluviimonas sp. WL0002]
MTALSPAIDRKTRDSFARQALMTTFGATIADLAPGACTLSAPILPIARQQHGVGHAGLTFALGDTAAGYAALTLMAEEAEVMTVEMKINLLAPAQGDRLIAEGRVIRPGRRISVVTAEVFAEAAGDRALVAILQGTMVPVTARSRT